MDYGTYIVTRASIQKRIARAAKDWSRTKLPCYLSDLHAYRAELSKLNRANPTCAKLFLTSQREKAQRAELDPDFYREPERQLEAA
jgi:hypothetical protein